MRTWLRGKMWLLFMTFALLLAIPAVALADNVQTNDVDTGGNASKEPGQSGTASVRIVGNNSPNGDVSGCNVSTSAPATVDFDVSHPSKLTIGSAQITACGSGGAKTVAYQVTSSAQAGDVITVTTETSGGLSGSKYNEDTFTVTVTAPANTAPVLSLPADINATATSSSGAVVNYTATATDEEDGDLTSAVECTPASGSTFPLGPTKVECSVEDSGGLKDSGSFQVNVTYGVAGILQPINGGLTLGTHGDDNSAFKLGSTVPVKFQLSGDSAGIENATAKLQITKVNNGILDGAEAEAITSTPASTGSLFRYDATSGQYIYNWGTKGQKTGTYQLRLDLGDGNGSHTVWISLK